MSHRLGGLMRGSLIYGVGQALGRSMTLLLLPLLTAYLDPAAYGILAILTAFGLLLHMVFSIGLGGAMAPHYFQGQQRAATVWTAFALLAVSTAVMLVLTLAFAGSLAGVMLDNDRYGSLVLLAATATAFNILSVPFRQFLMFEERPGLYVSLSLVPVALGLAVTVWFVTGLDRGVVGVLEADLIVQAVTCGLFAVPVLRHAPFVVRRQLATELLKLGLPLIPAFASVYVLQHGSRYILQWLHGPEQVGVYAVAVTLASAVGLFVAGFQSAWMPYFMRYADRQDEAREVFGRVAFYYVVAVGSASLLLYLFARPAVWLLADPEYGGAERAVGLAATAQLLSGSFLVLIPGMYFTREVKYVGLNQAVAAVLAVVLNVALVPRLGFVGSAVAVLVSYVVLNAGQLWWNRRRGYLEVRYDWRRLGRFGALYVILALLTFVPRTLSIAAECAVGLAASAVLALGVWTLLTPAERGAIRQRLAGHRTIGVADAARMGRGV